MEMLIIGGLCVLVVLCLIGAGWALRRGNQLDAELAATRLDEQFESLRRDYSERISYLEGQNDREHEIIRERLDTLEK
jgi:hypothetical protein